MKCIFFLQSSNVFYGTTLLGMRALSTQEAQAAAMKRMAEKPLINLCLGRTWCTWSLDLFKDPAMLVYEQL